MAADSFAKDGQGRPPNLFWTLAEGRAVFELGWFMTLRPLMSRLAKGDGHPVIVLPGFLASDGSTSPLRGVLTELGYATHDWGLGRNMAFSDLREAELLDMLEAVYHEYDEKVSLIGWSLGGVFAREIAKQRPEMTRCVISLGSPIRAPMEHSNAHHVYKRVNGAPSEEDHLRMDSLHEAPPVPTTSIYSKTDGIVAWQGSVQDPCSKNPFTENIEIPASHFGIGVNPFAVFAIADRLAQPDGEWSPFDRGGFKSVFFRAPQRGR